MATLNETLKTDEEFAFILQTEEIKRAERLKRNNKFDSNGSSRYSNNKAHKPNYIYVDDEIITIDDDNDSRGETQNFQLANKDELIKNDEMLARKLQEELDKEAAQRLEKSDRYRRREQTDPNDFIHNLRQSSFSPDLDLLAQPRPRSTLTNFPRLDIDSTDFRSMRRNNTDNVNNFDTDLPSNSTNTNSNRHSRRNDARQTNLNNFLQRHNSNNEVSDIDSATVSNTSQSANDLLDDINADFLFGLIQPINSSLNNFLNIATNHRSRPRLYGLNLNSDLGYPSNRRTNRRANHLLILNQFNSNNNDFTPEDYEDLLRLDEMNAIKKGVKKEEYDSLPKFEYKAANFDKTYLNESDRTCSICQDEYENRVKLTILACSHKFHHKCIKEWLVQSRRCPLCQKDAINGD